MVGNDKNDTLNTQKHDSLFTLLEYLGSPPFFLYRSVLVIFLIFCVVFFCYVCLRPVASMYPMLSVSGISILECTFGFL